MERSSEKNSLGCAIHRPNLSSTSINNMGIVSPPSATIIAELFTEKSGTAKEGANSSADTTMFSSLSWLISSSATLLSSPASLWGVRPMQVHQSTEECSKMPDNIVEMEENDGLFSMTLSYSQPKLAPIREKLSDAPKAEHNRSKVKLSGTIVPDPVADSGSSLLPSLIFNPNNAPLDSLVRRGDGLYNPADFGPGKEGVNAKKTNDDKNIGELPRDHSQRKMHKDTYVPKQVVKPAANSAPFLSATGLVFNPQGEKSNRLARKENRERHKKIDEMLAAKTKCFSPNSMMKKGSPEEERPLHNRSERPNGRAHGAQQPECTLIHADCEQVRHSQTNRQIENNNRV